MQPGAKIAEANLMRMAMKEREKMDVDNSDLVVAEEDIQVRIHIE